MSETAPPLNAAQAMDVAKSIVGPVQFADFRTVRGEFSIVPVEQAAPYAGKIHCRQHIESEEEDNGRIVKVRTDLACFLTPGQGEEPAPFAVKIEFSVAIAYRYTLDTDQRSAEVNSKVQAVFHSWPFWREFTISSTARLGVATEVAPMLPPIRAAVLAGFRESVEESAPRAAANKA